MGEMRISGFLFVPFQNFVDFGLMNVGLGLGGPIIPIGIARGALVASGVADVVDDDEEFSVQFLDLFWHLFKILMILG